MEAILVKACGFLFMIALGFVLKRIGLFSVEDSGVLSKIVLKITLPMAIISNFKGLELSSSFLIAIIIGFVVHFVAIAVVLLVTRKKPAEQRAFYIINTSGFNIGLCRQCHYVLWVHLCYCYDGFQREGERKQKGNRKNVIFLHAFCDLSGDDPALCSPYFFAGICLYCGGHDRTGECFCGDAADRHSV